MIRVIVLLLLALIAPYLVFRLIGIIRRTDQDIPVLWLGIAGVACALALLIILALIDPGVSSTDGAYQPPGLHDGEVRPGRFEQDRPPQPMQEPIRDLTA